MYGSLSAKPSASGPMRIPRTISTTTVGRISRLCSRATIAATVDAARTRTSERTSGATTGAQRAAGRGSPGARERGAGLQADQRLAAAERVRRAGHRLDRQAAPAHVRQRIAREEHEIAIAVVGPERERVPALRILELDVGEPSVSRSRSVKHSCRAASGIDPPRPSEVVLRPVDGRPPGRRAALVGGQDGAAGGTQDERVDPLRAEREVGMRARIRTGRRPDRRWSPWSSPTVRRPRAYSMPSASGRVAGPRVDQMLHHDRLQTPADEPPPSGRARGSRRSPPGRRWAPGGCPVELVAPVLEAVRPQDQHLPRDPSGTSRRRRSRRGHRGRRPSTSAARLQPRRRPPAGRRTDLDLLAGGPGHRAPDRECTRRTGSGDPRRRTTTRTSRPRRSPPARRRSTARRRRPGAAPRRRRRCRTRAGRRRSRRPRRRPRRPGAPSWPKLIVGGGSAEHPSPARPNATTPRAGWSSGSSAMSTKAPARTRGTRGTPARTGTTLDREGDPADRDHRPEGRERNRCGRGRRTPRWSCRAAPSCR